MPNPFQANPSPPPSSHSSSSRPTLSAPSWFSHIDPKRAGRSLLPFVLVLAAGSVLVLASYGGMESFAGMGVGSIDVNSEEIEVVKSPEEHPIFELMRNGEKKWEDVHSSQAETLEEAVDLYETTYHRPPPSGFPLWWDYTRNHSVHFTNPSSYASLEASLAPFRGLSPGFLRSQIKASEERRPVVDAATRIYKIWIENGECKGRSQKDWPNGRSGWEMCKKIESILHLLPDIPPFLYSISDFGTLLLSDEHKQNLTSIGLANNPMKLVPEGTIPPPYFPSSSLREHTQQSSYLAVASSCPSGSPARSFYLDNFTDTINWPPTVDQYALPASEGGFVRDFAKQSDVCYNTELRHQHGSLLQWPLMNAYVNHGTKEPDSLIMPVFSQSKFSTHSDFLVPQLYGYGAEKTWPTVAWENKSDIFIWRGRLTGVHYLGNPTLGGYWQQSQRVLLNAICRGQAGFFDLFWGNGTIVQQGTMLAKVFAKDYLDCGVTGFPPPFQAEDGEAVREEVTFTPKRDDYEKFKYVGDVDGFGWSGRFRDQMRIGSVIIKSTAYPEWHSSQLIPWYHYVPMRYDSSDLPQIMSFFVGSKTTPGLGSHDDEARKIAERGKAFVEHHWKKEDELAYLWRVLLEYKRLYETAPDGDMRPEEMLMT